MANIDASLIFVGNGKLLEKLKALAGRNEKVYFIDFVNQQKMPLIYRIADVYVLPSRGTEETWGLAINEAMACSRPVIVSDVCGAAIDLVQDGINGWIFESENLLDLQEKLKIAVEKKHELKEMGLNASALISAWNFEIQAEIIENIVCNNTNKN